MAGKGQQKSLAHFPRLVPIRSPRLLSPHAAHLFPVNFVLSVLGCPVLPLCAPLLRLFGGHVLGTSGLPDFSTPTMAITITHSRLIMACTAMVFFVLLTTSIPGAQARRLRLGCPCGETYVVRAGESLQSISEKCNDQFILENNPHIVDHDDLFEGQFLKMDCTPRKINLCEITGALPSYFC